MKKITTDGIVLGKRGKGEANALVVILTRELGLIYALARSSRKETSKLRYGLEPFTCGKFSLVRGAYEWKLTGTYDLVRCMPHELQARAAMGRVGRLLSRLIRGEEHSPHLYNAVIEGFDLFSFAKTKEEIENIECVLVLRILHTLGYLPKTPELAPFLRAEEFSIADAAHAASNRSALIRAINDSLQATGL